MDEQQRATALKALGFLIHKPLTEESWQAAAQFENFDRFLPKTPSSQDIDQLAAAHYETFGYLSPPMSSVYLGDLSQRWQEHLTSLNGAISFTQLDPSLGFDHLINQLDLVAQCLERKSQESGQVLFITLSHLQLWYPMFAAAVMRASHPFYQSVVALTGQLIFSLGLIEDADQDVSPLPAATDLQIKLNDPKTELRTLAELFATPMDTGLYLHRRDILQIGRKLQLPVGFTQRAETIVNLFESAKNYEVFETLCQELIAAAKAHREQLLGLCTTERSKTFWGTRIDDSIACLQEMAARAAKT